MSRKVFVWGVGSRRPKYDLLVIKILKHAHRCYRVFKNLRISLTFFVNYFKKRVYQKPNFKIREIKHFAKVNNVKI